MGGPMKTVPYPNTPIYTGLRQSSDQTLLFTQDYDSPPSQHSYSESLIYHQFKGSNPIFQQKYCSVVNSHTEGLHLAGKLGNR